MPKAASGVRIGGIIRLVEKISCLFINHFPVVVFFLCPFSFAFFCEMIIFEMKESCVRTDAGRAGAETELFFWHKKD